MMVRLRAEAALGTGAGVENDLRHRMARHRTQLALYEDIEQHDFTGRELSAAEQLQYLILQSGLATEREHIRFCEKALALLEALEPAES